VNERESYRYALDKCFLVTEEMVGVHPKHPDYPLLPGDVLTQDANGTWQKHTGLGMFGFVLSEAQTATLQPRVNAVLGVGGMDYLFGEGGS
jgi:hypothetical protein